ncbi:MAG TPA: hypothetical protein VFI65_32670 [Streptosporangiaceae bacterium]|nr:hypothetical protein [Streptosporangiaceae bacterium]
MNRAERKGVERVLRTAIDGTAAEVRTGELAPLHLMPRTGVAGSGYVRARRGMSRPVAALMAGAAVLALAAASFGAASALRADRAELTGQRPATGPLGLIPRYFVELDRPATGALRIARRALVIDSTTGKVVASVSVPKPYNSFSAVTAAADDRTFVLAATIVRRQRHGKFPPIRSKLLELRITPHPSGRVSETTNDVGLRIPQNWQGQGLALSPDGTKLALAASPFTKTVQTTVWVYSMVTGAMRAWQHHGEIGSAPWDARSLSWSADDKTLAYLWDVDGQVNLLRTRSPGGDLLAHSRTLISFTSPQDLTFDADLTPDGKKVVASIFSRIGGQINEYSAATGRLLATRMPTALSKLRLYDVLWTDNAGGAMIVYLSLPASASYPVRLLHGSQLIELKGIQPHLNPSDLAW